MVVRPSALQCGGDKNAPQALFKSICVQYGRLFRRKMPFVASTAKRQRGLQRGKLGSPLPCFASFCRSKRKAPAASGANYAFAKGSTPPIGDHKLSPAGQAHSLGLCKRPRPAGRRDETNAVGVGNPSVTAAPCHLPLHKGGFGGGAVLRAR